MKYIANSPNQNWEGMRRNSENEAEKDLFDYIKLFPNESHIGSFIIEEGENEEEDKQVLNKSLLPNGSTFVECNLLQCKFIQDKDTLEITTAKGNVRMKGTTDGGLILSSVKLKNLFGGRDFSFPGNDIIQIGYSQKIDKGKYQIIPRNSNYTPGAYKSLRMFVWWNDL